MVLACYILDTLKISPTGPSWSSGFTLVNVNLSLQLSICQCYHLDSWDNLIGEVRCMAHLRWDYTCWISLFVRRWLVDPTCIIKKKEIFYGASCQRNFALLSLLDLLISSLVRFCFRSLFLSQNLFELIFYHLPKWKKKKISSMQFVLYNNHTIEWVHTGLWGSYAI